MNKTALLILAVVLLLALGYGLFLSTSNAPTVEERSTPPGGETSSGAANSQPPASGGSGSASEAKTYAVEITDSGFSPSTLAIRRGDTVVFENKSSAKSRWPASGPHPLHTTCPGFDALKGIAKGESYSFTFRDAKTCPFHDHLNPSTFGRIVVE